MDLDARKRVYNQLRVDEGVEYKIYLDHLGYPTFGVGHLITENDPEHEMEVGDRVREERVEEVFATDLDIALNECEVLYTEEKWCQFPVEVQEILVNMMFNMGRPTLSKFRKFNAALLKHEWAQAAIEGRDSRWHKQVTNRAERLMVRLENV
jgi:GH24 family phage-related lysozyme (muramidase)